MIKLKDERIRIKNINKIKEGDYLDLPICMNREILLATTPSIYNNGVAYVDYTGIEYGYIRVKYLYQTSKKLKVQVNGKSKYTYNISPNIEYIIPITEGDGKYEVIIYENVSGSKYKQILTQSLDIIIKDEFYPFLHNNIYVDYKYNDAISKKTKEIIGNKRLESKKIESIYKYVINNFTYDYGLARTVKSAYVPNLSDVLTKKKGICFDYSALIVAMLRNANIPAKLVFGYAGNTYHAWIEVYIKSEFTLNNNFKLKANTWNRLDPTFDSTSKSNSKIVKYINNDKNYLPKYYY